VTTSQHRIPGSVTRTLARMLDEVIDRARVPVEHVLGEATTRGIPMTGATPHERLASLRLCPPAMLDPLARQYVSSSALAAGLQGFVANLGGVATLPLAVSADTLGTLAAAVRATSGVMGAYGFETETEHGAAQLRVGLLAAAGVSRITIEGTQIFVARLSRELVELAAARRLNAALTGQLSKRLVSGALWDRLPRAVPVVGGAIGAGVNAGMVRAMGGRARMHYRELLVEWQRNRGIVPPVVWDVPEAT
jgi:hypothetical protein